MLLATGGGIAWHAVDVLMVLKFKLWSICNLIYSHEIRDIKKLWFSILLDYLLKVDMLSSIQYLEVITYAGIVLTWSWNG